MLQGQKEPPELSGMRRGIPTLVKPLRKCQAKSCCTYLDLLLKGSNWEGFHHRLCWLCLHLGLFAEHHPHARFRGRLGLGLDAANAWDGEHTCLLDLSSGNGHKAVQHTGASLCFQVVLSGDCLQQCTLCHCLPM